MKVNINKVCDLKSISVFPPNLRRRSSVGPSEPQALQQSLSQGPSSRTQRGCFSQMTQSSFEELLINDQRFSSQERHLSLKKNSFLPPINYKRDDSQMKSRDAVRESVPKSQEDTTFHGDGNGNQEHSAEFVSDQELQGEEIAKVANSKTARGCDDAEIELTLDVLHKNLVMSETCSGGSLNLDACVVCGLSDKRVSRCCGSDCLLSFHVECLIDELGSSVEDLESPYYCPYCWFNFLAVMEMAVGVEKADSSHFMYLEDKEMKSTDEVNESVQEDTASDGDGNGNQEHSADFVSELRGEEEEDCSSKGEHVQAGSDEVKEDTTFHGDGNGNQEHSADFVSDQELQGEEEEDAFSSTGEQVKVGTDVTFFKIQRKQIFWTFEEEETLKVGVVIFAAKAKKNMPWRKILEMGKNVFHETRSAENLKDKWRRMISR